MQRIRGNTEKGNTAEPTEGNTMIKDEQGIGYYPLKEGLKGQRFYPGRLGYHPDNWIKSHVFKIGR